jgi:type II secretion system protein J
MKKNGLTGLTFVELLVAISIFCVIVASLYSTLRVGLSAYRKGEQLLERNQKARLCLDSLALDLRNAYSFSDKESKFIFQDDLLSFYTLKKLHAAGVKNNLNICKVEYWFEEGNLFRKIYPGKSAFSDSAKDKADIILDNVVKLKIEFAYKTEAEDKLIWKDEWKQTDSLPMLVRIELELNAPNSNQAIELTKFVNLALGQLVEEKEK